MAVIGIMDSGVGGLSVYREIRGLMPRQKYIYFSDNGFCPYGEKSQEFIQDRCRKITEILIGKGAGVIVIACNTATAAAVSVLRKEFSLPFIGMEPALKPAVLGTVSGTIGVLATAGTLKASKYLNVKGMYEGGVKIAEHVGKGFVELVEAGELEGERTENIVRASLQPLLDAGADTIVLGCTHYPFLLPVMKRIAPASIRFIDPAPAVARRLSQVLKDNGMELEDADPGLELMSSAPSVMLSRLAEISTGDISGILP